MTEFMVDVAKVIMNLAEAPDGRMVALIDMATKSGATLTFRMDTALARSMGEKLTGLFGAR